eukprot:scaffold29686_cov75-Attheya_sp.AAC.2
MKQAIYILVGLSTTVPAANVWCCPREGEERSYLVLPGVSGTTRYASQSNNHSIPSLYSSSGQLSLIGGFHHYLALFVSGVPGSLVL